MTRTTIGLTGDVMLGRLVDRRQSERDPGAVWGDLGERLRGVDALLVNLESVLSTRGEQWTETRRPFHFRADPGWAVPALAAAGVDYAGLANNHALDYRAPALRDTIDALEGAGIAHAGAGTPETAWRPATVRAGDLEVAVVAATDNTPEYAATDDRIGVAHTSMDVDDGSALEPVREALSAARERDPDLLVASLHWGPNMEASPDEEYERFGRWLVEQGVDLVHGHSAHVFQGIEAHQGAPIIYDCGDFVDDYRVDPDLRNDRSFLYEVVIEDGEVDAVRLRPVEIEAKRARVRAATGDVEWWERTLRERSEPYGTADAVERDGATLRLPV